MHWITRERPKIDRVACPWLIRRFIDKEAVILYLPFDEVVEKSRELGGIPFDIPDVEFTHYGDRCTFDYFLEKYALPDPALHVMAAIVRGADTDHHELASQCAGLWAIAAGMARNIPDDQQLLEAGMVIYDAIYTWAAHLQHEKHVQQPDEALLLQVLRQVLQPQEQTGKRTPSWAREIKALIQDQIDSQLSLKELSRHLQVNPSYLSREFAKHFDNLHFGEYLRKQRIDKAIELMAIPDYSLTDIAYFTGFSDQSHFNRVFKQLLGETPAAYRKKITEK